MIVPKSTLGNWMNEFRRFCPTIKTLKFHGNAEDRVRASCRVGVGVGLGETAGTGGRRGDCCRGWWLWFQIWLLSCAVSCCAASCCAVLLLLCYAVWLQEVQKAAMSPGSFDVVITSYEMVIKEKNHFKKFHWRYIIIDEAHRIKNENSRLSLVCALRGGGGERVGGGGGEKRRTA